MNRIFGGAAIDALVLAAACAATSSMTDNQEQGAAPTPTRIAPCSVTSKIWRAYLSAAPMNGPPQVNARAHIGKVPGTAQRGVEIWSAVVDQVKE